MKKLWHYAEKLFGVYRWHPKIALRYLPVVEEIKRRNLLDKSILEIGSGGLGIAPYLRRKVVGLDTEFSEPLFDLLIPVKGNARALPFADQSFTTVLSVDMLEHLRLADRERTVAEMLRVAKELVCIGVPCGNLAARQDSELDIAYQKQAGRDFQFLAEQVKYGLPTRDEMFATIKAAAKKIAKKVEIETQGNLNLHVRQWLMHGWLSSSFLENLFFRKILLMFIPLLSRLNQEPVYRQIFFVRLIND